MWADRRGAVLRVRRGAGAFFWLCARYRKIKNLVHLNHLIEPSATRNCAWELRLARGAPRSKLQAENLASCLSVSPLACWRATKRNAARTSAMAGVSSRPGRLATRARGTTLVGTRRRASPPPVMCAPHLAEALLLLFPGPAPSPDAP